MMVKLLSSSHILIFFYFSNALLSECYCFVTDLVGSLLNTIKTFAPE